MDYKEVKDGGCGDVWGSHNGGWLQRMTIPSIYQWTPQSFQKGQCVPTHKETADILYGGDSKKIRCDVCVSYGSGGRCSGRVGCSGVFEEKALSGWLVGGFEKIGLHGWAVGGSEWVDDE